MLITILATAVVLGVLIFVHELGHFVTAKLVDIEVPRFSIGFGPKVVGFRWGETEYVLSLLPLGGYVKMAGMEELEPLEGGAAKGGTAAPDAEGPGAAAPPGAAGGATRERGPRDFESKPLWARTLVISAGVIMNVIFAFCVFTFSALVWGVEPPQPPLIAHVVASELPAGTEALARVPAGARVVSIGDRPVRSWSSLRQAVVMAREGLDTVLFADAPPVAIDMPAREKQRLQLFNALEPVMDFPPVAGGVVAGMPAHRAGIQSGDRIVEVMGRPVHIWQDLVSTVQGRAGQPTSLVVERGGRRVPITVTPEPTPDTLGSGAVRSIGRIGIEPVPPAPVRPGLAGAIVHGARQTYHWIALTIGFLRDLITGRQSARNLGGPILIGQISGQVARLGLQAFLTFMAYFSVNLAVLNLLPIPVLDGGQLMFLAVEGVRGRALTLEQKARLMQVGFVLVLALMVWAIANDVLRLFGV